MKELKRIAALALACLLIFTAGSGNVFAASMQENTEQTKEEVQEALVNYLVVQEPMVTSPGTQTVMMGIGDGSMEIEAASLRYQNQETEQIYETQAFKILE